MQLLAKLKIKMEDPVYIINAPAECMPLFEEADVKTNLPGRMLATQLVLFVLDSVELDSFTHKLEGKLAENVVFWIAYPKKSGRIQSDLIRNEGWKLVFANYDGVSSASIDNDWSAVRFKMKDPDKKYIPPEERVTEGVDYKARTVVLPPDALKAMKPYKDLDEFFYSMSFTHKKEHIVAIVEAKKAETRQRRIEKMVEMVLKLRTEKELKKKKV